MNRAFFYSLVLVLSSSATVRADNGGMLLSHTDYLAVDCHGIAGTGLISIFLAGQTSRLWQPQLRAELVPQTVLESWQIREVSFFASHGKQFKVATRATSYVGDYESTESDELRFSVAPVQNELPTTQTIRVRFESGGQFPEGFKLPYEATCRLINYLPFFG